MGTNREMLDFFDVRDVVMVCTIFNKFVEKDIIYFSNK